MKFRYQDWDCNICRFHLNNVVITEKNPACPKCKNGVLETYEADPKVKLERFDEHQLNKEACRGQFGQRASTLYD